MHRQISSAVLSLLGPLISISPAWAQNNEATTPESAEPAKLEMVVVSGQGRTQQLQSVPIAIQVLGAEQMRKLGAANLGDLDRHIPGLQLNSDEATQPRMAMRGIGSNDFGIGTDSPVGIYVDGVYAGKSGGALLNFNDIKRIEVLKGPQGTLFGRNSAGGAISIVTNDPAFKPEAQGLLRLGENGLRHFEALLNQPLGENLALRASVVSQHSDGFLKDAGTGQKAGGEGAWGAKLALKWQAGEDTSALLSYEHEKLDQRARPAIGLVKDSQAPLPFPADPQSFLDPHHARLFNDVKDDRETRDFDGLTLRIEHSLPWGEFKSTTAYRRFNTLNRQDNDGTRNPLAYLSTTSQERTSSWSQEFRLSAKTTSVDWLTGLSLYQETARQSALINASTSSLNTITANVGGGPLFSTVNGLAQMAGMPGIDVLGQDWQEAMHNEGRFRALAWFGDAIWHLTPNTNLTAGLRLTRDQKRFSWYNPLRTAAGLDQQLGALDAAQFFPGLVTAGILSQADADGLQTALRGNLLVATSGATNSPLLIEKNWTDLSPRLVIDHKLDRDLMVYASLTRGYQAGGFNTLQVNSIFEPEHVTNGELGLKGQWPQQGLSYSAALFHYRFDNLQTMDLVPASTPGGLPAYQVTISDQKATGLDLEARWQLNRQWRVSGALEYIDQTYSRGRGSAGADLSGLPVGTPKLNISLSLDHQVTLWGGTLNSGLQWAYSSTHRCNPESVVQGQCLSTPNWRMGGSKQHWDARLAWDSSADAAGRSWGLALLANNLGNEQTIHRVSYEAAPMGGAYATLGRPRSFALEVRASY